MYSIGQLKKKNCMRAMCMCIVHDVRIFLVRDSFVHDDGDDSQLKPCSYIASVDSTYNRFKQFSFFFHKIKENRTRNTEWTTPKNMSINVRMQHWNTRSDKANVHCTAPHTVSQATENAISEIWPYQYGINCNHEALFSVQSTAQAHPTTICG